MYLAPFLHIYQPPTQFKAVLEKIVNESYEKIVKILAKNPNSKITLNICASLTEQLAANFPKIISEIANLAKQNKIEFTGSAAYHPLLPKLPEAEIARQITINHQINQKYFGQVFAPTGFFPPEAAYSEKLGDILERARFRWVILEDVACPPTTNSKPQNTENLGQNVLFRRKKGKLYLFFRNRAFSLEVAFGRIKSLAKLKQYLGSALAEDSFIIMALDGETFGHHQKGSEKFLDSLFKFGQLETVTVSELFDKFTKISKIQPRESTWGMSESECSLGQIYPRWDLPKNPIHKLQWQLTYLALNSVKDQKDSIARSILDKALHSDQYWWASHNPYWHYNMVLAGANMLKEVVLKSKNSSQKAKLTAVNLRNKIANLGLKLYGDTVIDF